MKFLSERIRRSLLSGYFGNKTGGWSPPPPSPGWLNLTDGLVSDRCRNLGFCRSDGWLDRTIKTYTFHHKKSFFSLVRRLYWWNRFKHRSGAREIELFSFLPPVGRVIHIYGSKLPPGGSSVLDGLFLCSKRRTFLFFTVGDPWTRCKHLQLCSTSRKPILCQQNDKPSQPWYRRSVCSLNRNRTVHRRSAGPDASVLH